MKIYFRDKSSDGPWTLGQINLLDRQTRLVVEHREANGGYTKDYDLSSHSMLIHPDSMIFCGYQHRGPDNSTYELRCVEVRFRRFKDMELCPNTKRLLEAKGRRETR